MPTSGPAAENPHAGQGSVLLDIGGDVGALVVTMPPAMEGVEIEIRPRDVNRDHGPEEHRDGHGHHHDHDHDHGMEHLTHVAVVGRPAQGRTIYSAVFGDLSEGGYELGEKPFGQVRLTVEVTGGEVTEAVWPR
jgi:hypothetical protein